MSDVDHRDEHRKALEHIERLGARLAAAEVAYEEAVRERDTLTARVKELERRERMRIATVLADARRAALATPEDKR